MQLRKVLTRLLVEGLFASWPMLCGARKQPFNPFAYPASFGAPRAVQISFRPATEKTMQRARQARREGHTVSVTFEADLLRRMERMRPVALPSAVAAIRST